MFELRLTESETAAQLTTLPHNNSLALFMLLYKN